MYSVSLLYLSMQWQYVQKWKIYCPYARTKVCETCHKHLLKGKIPCQAVRKIMRLYPARNELKVIKRLGRILISKIIFLRKKQ